MTQESDPHSVIPPKKSFITMESLLEVWDARGMKYRVDELHESLMSRGLQSYVDRPRFRKVFMDILTAFLVEGDARRDPKRIPLQRLPRLM